MPNQIVKKRLAVRLLNVVFSIYLVITVLITLTQMFNEYLREQANVRKTLGTTETIFSASLTTAIWDFDGIQLNASLEGILKMPKVIGLKIDQMDKPSDWSKPFPIRLGITLDDNGLIKMNGKPYTNNKPYLQLISHTFQLRKDNLLLGDITFYSSNEVVFDAVKYSFLAIIIAAIIKTIVLWLLFIWAFNLFLGKQLNVFCETMDHADIDNPETTFLNLKTDDIEELCRIEQAFNDLFKRVLDRKQKLDELNETLEQKVIERTRELEQVNAKLLQLSTIDGLTDLANRRYFDEVLDKECHRANRAGHPLALLMMDIDEFKKYNDHYGHQAGDDCLINFAKILRSHVHRVGDLAARYGGEEFAFIAPATDEQGAIRLGTRICIELANKKLPHSLSPFDIVTTSIGVALYIAGEDPKDLIKKADQALYSAKQQGRNCVVLYNSEHHFNS
ncbi:Phytochrome-like protein cph2 [uncultured bacterium]|nr:Phytochrome-like protein cph2 [uncultured bacterium]